MEIIKTESVKLTEEEHSLLIKATELLHDIFVHADEEAEIEGLADSAEDNILTLLDYCIE